MASGTLQTVMKTVKHTNKECRCRKWVLKMCKHSLVLLLFWLGRDKGACVVFVRHIRWNQQDE
jgi:hypothetical protein